MGSRCSNFINLIKSHIKFPRKYRLFHEHHKYSRGEHEHICYPFRMLSDRDFQILCPHCLEHEFEPECSDLCDECKYFGFVDFDKDEIGKRNIQFGMSKTIVHTWDD